MADRLRTTLHAAASDEAIRDALAEGRLFDEAQAGGAWPFALEPGPREERGAKKRAAAKRGAKSGDDARAEAARRRATTAGERRGKRGAAKRGAKAGE